MPAGGTNSTYHKKVGTWDFWQYKFAPTVIVAEKKLKWYDEDKLLDLAEDLREEEGVRTYWEKGCRLESYVKQHTPIELYKRYPKDTPFKEKMQDMQRIIEKYNL
jgi:hypothetical protein